MIPDTFFCAVNRKADAYSIYNKTQEDQEKE